MNTAEACAALLGMIVGFLGVAAIKGGSRKPKR